jgi:hypothetical protein
MCCEQLNKKINIKICLIQCMLLMLMAIGFQHISLAQNSSMPVVDSVSKDSIKAKPIETVTSVSPTVKAKSISDEKIGKLPFKKSQLPELLLSICILGIMAALRYFFPRYLPEIFSQQFNLQSDSRVLKNDKISESFPGVIYEVLYLLTSSVIILFSIQYLKKIPSVKVFSAVFMFKLISVFVIYFTIRIILSKVIFLIFKQKNFYEITKAYKAILRHVMVVFAVGTICFLLLNRLESLARFSIIVYLSAWIVLNIFMVFKLLLFARKTTDINFLDILLYLCAVEVLPTLLLITFIIRNLILVIPR